MLQVSLGGTLPKDDLGVGVQKAPGKVESVPGRARKRSVGHSWSERMLDRIRKGLSSRSQRPAEPLGICAMGPTSLINRDFSETRGSPGPFYCQSTWGAEKLLD